eukprot:Em0006g968a
MELEKAYRQVREYMGLQHLQQKQLYNKSSNGDTFKVEDMSDVAPPLSCSSSWQVLTALYIYIVHRIAFQKTQLTHHTEWLIFKQRNQLLTFLLGNARLPHVELNSLIFYPQFEVHTNDIYRGGGRALNRIGRRSVSIPLLTPFVACNEYKSNDVTENALR